MAYDMISHGKRTVRESCLSSIVISLTNHKNISANSDRHSLFTLLTHCLQVVSSYSHKNKPCSKKPASKSKSKSRSRSRREIYLCLKAISLVAMNVNDKTSSYEVYKQALPLLIRALTQFESDSKIIIMVVDCLAIVAFFGCSQYEEIQSVMLIIWDRLIGNNNISNSLVRNRAISCWSFLLSAILETGQFKLMKKIVNVPDMFDLLLDKNVVDDAAMVLRAVAAHTVLIFEGGGFTNEEMIDKLREIVFKGRSKEEISSKAFDQDKDGKKYAEVVQVRVLISFLGDKGFVKHVRNNYKLFRFKSWCVESDEDEDSDSHDDGGYSAVGRKQVMTNVSRSEAEKQIHKRKVKSKSRKDSLKMKAKREERTRSKFNDQLHY